MQSCLTATTRRVLSDTAVPSRYDAQIAPLTPSERFLRALALSTCVRGLAWQGARLNAESPDTAGVVLRFVRQLYGGGETSETRQRDVRRLIALNRPRLDSTYLERWATELKVDALLPVFLK